MILENLIQCNIFFVYCKSNRLDYFHLLFYIISDVYPLSHHSLSPNARVI